ncbi:VOC family protein [Micrococcus porci]|uniref:VOC family protein n=1 Tax=Micrococcus porci TaxID=2856555 RepID=UPI001CCE3ACA|nr:VOC family protein [Micrococcus porci]UBH25750.1 VOC family protein [Micrococcus porci]
MGIRFENVGIAVEDLEEAVDFFQGLGLVVVGRDEVQGEWADTAVGLDGNHARIALLTAPDGGPGVELFEYLHPEALPTPDTLPHMIGMHRVAFRVDDLDAALAACDRRGYAPLRGVADYEGVFRLTYVRGPSGIVVMLAQATGEG